MVNVVVHEIQSNACSFEYSSEHGVERDALVVLILPRIVALNNQEAKILVGTNQPYATRSISQTSGGASNIEAENVTFLDLGVKLYVTPTINEDNYITMKIKPEVSSSIESYTIASSGNTIPVVKTTTTETTVMVKDKATILIGGLIEDSERENTREIPGLANIPIIGGIFRSHSKGSLDSKPEKTELVIFLTPHIITGEEAKDMLTVDKVAHGMVMKKIEANKELSEDDIKDVMVDDILPQQYYDLISTMITKKVEGYRPSLPVYGEVIISFDLASDGSLISYPTLYWGENKALSDIGIKSVVEAAPFPPFPKSVNKDRQTFKIAISYE